MSPTAVADLRAGDELIDVTGAVRVIEHIGTDTVDWTALTDRGQGLEKDGTTRETVPCGDVDAALADGRLERYQPEPIALSEETLAILDGDQRRADVATLAEVVAHSTAARGVDWWATQYVGLSASEWARMTDRDTSTVSRNAKRADGRY